MICEKQLVNIKCPMCGTTLVSTERGEEVKGPFRHKCGKCKRYWRIDYTNNIVYFIKGKGDKTPIRKWRLDPMRGECRPYIHL